MAIRFITNHGATHKKELSDLFDSADEIIIAVGFFRMSGLHNIKDQLRSFCKQKDKRTTFFVGTGIGATEPKALEGLYNILKGRVNHRLIVCTPASGIFHPKIYTFITGNKATIITGSANLTESGWLKNDEVSMLYETTTESKELGELKSYFDKLVEKYEVPDVARVIDEYTNHLNEYLEGHPPRAPFRFRKDATPIGELDLDRIRGMYETYSKSDWFSPPREREISYAIARENLEVLASNQRLSAQQFHDLFGPLVGHRGYQKLWHSGNLHRRTYQTLDYARGFRDLVRVVKQNSHLRVSTAFDNVMDALHQMRRSRSIFGVGENIMAEMMMTYNPNKFPNLNNNPLYILGLLDIDFPPVSSFTGDDYKEYVRVLTQIKNELRFGTFLEVDSFLNYFYWSEQEMM